MPVTSTRLQLALGGLAALLVVHLLDSLRTDAEAEFPGVLLTPQAVLGIGGAIVALVLERRDSPAARRVAVVVAGLIAAGFVVVHGLPVASERTEPYWGDGRADVGQWAGLLAVLGTAAATIVLARRDVSRSPR
jgi:hypothetical protein